MQSARHSRVTVRSQIYEGVGWGTWTRTRTDGVRVRCSTIKLFPNTRAGRVKWARYSQGSRVIQALVFALGPERRSLTFRAHRAMMAPSTRGPASATREEFGFSVWVRA